MKSADPQFLSGLKSILGDGSLVEEREELRAYECDGLSAHRTIPMLVALPETTAQVQQILKLCYSHRVPVVARGAGTGLSGGAQPLEDGLLLSLARFNRILAIDPDNRSATVQPGVRNLAISEAAKPHGLYYAPDPSSQIACTIGGNVAENSGGVHCLKYGLTVHNVRKLRVICIDGEELIIGSDALDAPGYDLLALMNGSEGLLGIIVEVTVGLLPIPPTAKVIMAAFSDAEDAGEAVKGIIASGIIPAGLEMMDNLAIRAAEDFVHVGYPTDAAAILLCELDGTDEEISHDIGRIEQILLQRRCTSTRISSNDEERMQLWAGRKSAFPAVGRLAPDYYCMDGTIPRHRLPEVLRRVGELSRQYQLAIANVFHAGDGNLHPLILYDANKGDQLQRAEELGSRILQLCVEVGGTITGEHGVGSEKIDEMCVQFKALELQQFHAIKAAFDEHGLLNPGKAVPELHRCAELGAMHVHNGELPFPELERF
ncbi:MAG: FAD-linked oxidase C-terminal domain-containing protein [Pseudomonadota bacterium]